MKKSVRLSKNIVPEKYDLTLKPDIENFTFEGNESIYISVLKETNKITLHSAEIEIESVSISSIDKNPSEILRKNFSEASEKFLRDDSLNRESFHGARNISYDKKSETATFLFPKKIKKGKHKLNIVFKGIINDKMRGFYRSAYEHNGKQCFLATTQFEATDARRAFPCFDEPAQKAEFCISLVVKNSDTAISNTFEESITDHSRGLKTVQFAPTPKMSTYLALFIVGDFEYIEWKTKRGTKVRVFTTKGKKQQAKFSLSVAVKSLEFYEDYFSIKYPLPKLDMIAIPDFSSGAMENWGAITYRESAILFDEEKSSIDNKIWIAIVIAHEIAHQWFGNLVTMEWWTHLWLNEGFASFAEYTAVDKIFPEWKIWQRFLNLDQNVAYRLDSLLKTHPIEIEVYHPSEIKEIFDAISYKKGAAIIRMLADFLGEKNFKKGLSEYLKKHSYKNTETNHLWESLEKESKLPVGKIMKNWTAKPGYPFIHVEEKKGKITLLQNRFFISPISMKKAKDKTIWQIPISIKTNKEVKKFLLTNNKSEIKLKDFSWIKVNFGESGFYRVSYSKDLLHKIGTSIKKFDENERWGIVKDIFAFAELGKYETNDVLEFIKSFNDEKSHHVLSEIATGLSKIKNIFYKNIKIKENIEKVILEIFSPIANNLGFEKKKSDSHETILLRTLAISLCASNGDKNILTELIKIFDRILKKEKVNPDMRDLAYFAYAKLGGVKEYNKLVELYKEETLSEEKDKIGSALSSFQSEAILKKVLAFGISKNVRFQDTISIVFGVGTNKKGSDTYLEFLDKNWNELKKRYSGGGHELSDIIKPLMTYSDKNYYKTFLKLFKHKKEPGIERTIEQVEERMLGNIAWLERDEKKLEKYFL